MCCCSPSAPPPPPNLNAQLLTCASCRSRATGKGILPLNQGLVDIQAEVLNTHSSALEYESRSFSVSGNALTQYSFKDLMHLRGNIHFLTIHRVSLLAPVPGAESNVHKNTMSGISFFPVHMFVDIQSRKGCIALPAYSSVCTGIASHNS